MHSNKWEVIYSSGKQMNKWPWSDLISLYMRTRGINTSVKYNQGKILEIGCGSGNNFGFFESLELEYYGFDVSPTAIQSFLERYPYLGENLHCSELESYKFESDYNTIVDRASLTHMDCEKIKFALKRIFKVLAPGGIFIGVDWFSTRHGEFNSRFDGRNDGCTHKNFKDGVFAGLGTVHFADREHLVELFSDFEVLELSEKVITNFVSITNSPNVSTFNIVARKPHD